MCLWVHPVFVHDLIRVCVLAQAQHGWCEQLGGVCVSPRARTWAHSCEGRSARPPPESPAWAQLGPQSLSWQMPNMNIWPHLPIRKGVLKAPSELEGPSPRLQPREGLGLHQVTWQMEAEQGPSLNLGTLGRDRCSPGPHCSCPPPGPLAMRLALTWPCCAPQGRPCWPFSGHSIPICAWGICGRGRVPAVSGGGL